MIHFFVKGKVIYLVHIQSDIAVSDIQKLEWLFDGARLISESAIAGFFIGPRREMITPWSTNAVEITQNMGIVGILRMEEFTAVKNENAAYDRNIWS